MEATNPSTIDFKNPYWLRSIGGVIEVAKVRPKADDGAEGESDFDHLVSGLKDAVHSVVNNTCRACGLEMGGADSEATWDWCVKLGDRVEEFIRSEWKRQDAEEEARKKREENDYRLLNDYLARVNGVRARRGLPALALTPQE